MRSGTDTRDVEKAHQSGPEERAGESVNSVGSKEVRIDMIGALTYLWCLTLKSRGRVLDFGSPEL
jgi:hypothetical protein